MSANIYNKENYAEIRARIDKLSAASLPKWGRMNVVQMLEHCARQLLLALGEIEQQDVEGSPMMRTRFGRWFALYVLPWSRGLPTPSKMDMVKSAIPVVDFDTQKANLIEVLDKAIEACELSPHPFFGKLNRKEWGRLIWKHLDHHLKQFGC